MSTNSPPDSDALQSEQQPLRPALATTIKNESHPDTSNLNVGFSYPPLPAGAAYPPSSSSTAEVNDPLLDSVAYNQTTPVNLPTGSSQQSVSPSIAVKHEASPSNPINFTIAGDATQKQGSIKLLMTPLKNLLSWIKDIWKKPQDHWRLLSASVLVIILIISLPLGSALRLKPFNDHDSVEPETGDATLQLGANLVSVDVDHLTITLDWFIESYNCTSCTDVDLYFDQNLLSRSGNSGSPPANNNLPSQPIFFLNATTWTNSNLGALANTATFRTDISLSNSPTTTLQAYPFDKYNAQIFFFANTSSGYISIGISNTTGIAVGFAAKLDLQHSSISAESGLLITLDIARGPAVYMYAIIIIIAIWSVTLIFLAVCVSVYLKRGIPAAILALPVAALFAFTSLRGTMPGAPTGFGADIDFIGILPCLVLLTFSSLFMIGVFLFRNPEKTAGIPV